MILLTATQFVVLTVRFALERRAGNCWVVNVVYCLFLKVVDFQSCSYIAPEETPSPPLDAVMQTWVVFFFASQL